MGLKTTHSKGATYANIEKIEIDYFSKKLLITVKYYVSEAMREAEKNEVQDAIRVDTRITELVSKGNTVYKTESELYDEIFNDEFKQFAKNNDMAGLNINSLIEEKRKKISKIKSGRTDEENKELSTLQMKFKDLNSLRKDIDTKIFQVDLDDAVCDIRDVAYAKLVNFIG